LWKCNKDKCLRSWRQILCLPAGLSFLRTMSLDWLKVGGIDLCMKRLLLLRAL
jgi:hypothetical protein